MNSENNISTVYKEQTVQNIAIKLIEFWQKQGCEYVIPYDYPMSAATFHPQCFFGTFDDKKSLVYIQPCRRKADGRYGKSPNRFFIHHQVQVFINPIPENIRDLYFESLAYAGLNLEEQDFKFIENNWENTSLGATGVGWEVWCNAMEITQWTYFHKIGDIALNSTPVELAYGLERVALHILDKETINECMWTHSISYQDQFQRREYEFSQYIFSIDDITIEDFLKLYKKAQNLINHGLYIPTYEILLEMNSIFNGLDAQCKIDYFSRKTYIENLRSIANECCKLHIKQKKLCYNL